MILRTLPHPITSLWSFKITWSQPQRHPTTVRHAETARKTVKSVFEQCGRFPWSKSQRVV